MQESLIVIFFLSLAAVTTLTTSSALALSPEVQSATKTLNDMPRTNESKQFWAYCNMSIGADFGEPDYDILYALLHGNYRKAHDELLARYPDAGPEIVQAYLLRFRPNVSPVDRKALERVTNSLDRACGDVFE